jgi:putative ABC transport system permease protein
MSIEALFGAVESGLIYSLVALGVLISFRILDFPDLTADGSFPLGGAVAAVCIVNGINPWLACAAGMAAGACAGVVTAWLHVSLKILQLLASILVMVALYSVNLRIMGAPNVPLIGEQTVFTPFVAADFSNQFWVQPLIILGFVIAAKLLLDWFFSTEAGLSMRATGANGRMARAQGVGTSKMIIIGMALSNALIALGGALFVQTQGGADISIGVGTIVIGLAAVIIGETLLPSKRIWHAERPTPRNHLQPRHADRNPRLRGMSLDIPAGQFVTVIGSNGAGKSTFLNAISGDQTVDSGRIAIDGVDVTRMPVWARAERVARVFQDPMAGTCEDLTIEENMALASAAARSATWAAPSRHPCARAFASAWPRWAWGWKTA